MKLVLLRHGESIWNKENRFTGWTDVSLSDKGIEEAVLAGKLLKANNYDFDLAYTSVLKRANDTLDLVLKEMNKEIPIIYNWKLNERHYGALQGLNKEETINKYGAEQVRQWRRSFSTLPPLLTKSDPRYPGLDPKYKELNEVAIPLGESLELTMARVIEYYNNEIKNELLENKNILIVAHGNSLRSLIKYLENISDDEIMSVEIPTGKPYVYELDNNLKILAKYYL